MVALLMFFGMYCTCNFTGLPLAEWLCVPSSQRLNIGSSPTVGAVFSAMKAEYVVVAEQAHPLDPAYSFPNYFYPAAYKLSTCFDHHSILCRI